ncbi:MAG TPA: hypothetical protein VN156_04355 [Pseudomonas sp.]|nr:hypothetical protein [Pseudomonas sp.]
MSLREQLKRAVASCAPIETQHATSGPADATSRATTAQRRPANPHETRNVRATARATRAQQEAQNSATFDAQQDAPSCAQVASELTAQRVMKKLLAAAMLACDAHGDSDEAREQMRRDVMGTPPEQQADLLAHFQQTYGGRA